MNRFRTATIAAVAFVPLVAGGFLLQDRPTRDSARLFDQVLTLVSGRFVDTVGTAALYEKAARGLVAELNDPYTELLTPKDLQGFSTQTNGRYAGIGMQIEQQESWVTVSRVFPNTPAEMNGVREGDRIVGIDTVSTKGWSTSKVSETLLGEPGTRVTVRFTRPGVPEPIVVRFTRAIINIPAVPYAMMLDGRVAYVPVQRFNETAAEELESSIQRLLREGARSLVLDLRGNPGGILDESIALTSLFLPKGTEVASVRGRGMRPQTYDTDKAPIVPKSTPVIVLTDGYSASASEIVAGALQDHDRALVVGTTSFGKGMVQTLFPLDGGYALKLTTAKWFTPSGRSIQKERKVVDGQLVDQSPDSLETDSVRKSRPAYRSTGGRTVYGGGAITPDVIVPEDTITTAEQVLARQLATKAQTTYTVLHDYAMELRPGLRPDFVVQPAWREELYRRLQNAGVIVDRAHYDAGAPYVDRILGHRVARLAFGDSTAKRREVPSDAALSRALELLAKGQTQRDLFTLAQQAQMSAQQSAVRSRQ